MKTTYHYTEVFQKPNYLTFDVSRKIALFIANSAQKLSPLQNNCKFFSQTENLTTLHLTENEFSEIKFSKNALATSS